MEAEKINQAEKIYKSFLDTAKWWIKELDFYGHYQFKQKTPESDWTIGQVYDHLINGTYTYQLQQIRNCLVKINGAPVGKKKMKGKFLFFLGRFPNVKVKGVNQDYIPNQPESPAKMKDDFYRFIKAMQKTAKEIDASNLDYKTENPSLGWLNALEWFKLIEMHFKHHLRQKSRLDKHIRSIYKAVPEEDASLEV